MTEHLLNRKRVLLMKNDPANSELIVQQFGRCLVLQLGKDWKESITAAQRDEVQRALRTHRESVAELTFMRAEALEQMNHDLQAEIQGSLDPVRIKQLSNQVWA